MLENPYRTPWAPEPAKQEPVDWKRHIPTAILTGYFMIIVGAWIAILYAPIGIPCLAIGCFLFVCAIFAFLICDWRSRDLDE